jgi:hypothetical protein
MTNRELLDLCDGTTGDEMHVLAPIEDLARVGALSRFYLIEDDSMWIPSGILRKIINQNLMII